MSLEIKVPAVGESITEVTIAQWFKQEGDHVEMDEVICELESDKATFELNAEAAGTLQIVAKEGDTLDIGEIICRIDESGAGATPKAEAPTAASTPAPTSVGPKPTGEVKEMIVPTVGESITEVTISSWLKADGDYVELDEIIAEVDSDKATFELPAEANGILRIVAQEDSTIEIGALICKIEVMEGGAPIASAPTAQSPASDSAQASGNETYATGHASPAAAKILAERGIDASNVVGTGKDGRITKEDAEKAQVAPPKPAAAPASTKAETAPAPAPVIPGSRNESRERMSALRKTVAKRLVSVKNETAMLTTFNEVNMKPIMDLRKKYKENAEYRIDKLDKQYDRLKNDPDARKDHMTRCRRWHLKKSYGLSLDDFQRLFLKFRDTESHTISVLVT